MKCKECNDETNQIKAGKTKAGTQKYKCKICGKYYVLEGKKREYSEEIRKQAIKLYMEGNRYYHFVGSPSPFKKITVITLLQLLL